MTRQAVILAGGLGTRLRSVVSDLPKSMAEVNGRPFLEYQFDYLIRNGIQNVVVSAGYLGAAIEKHFGNLYHSLEIAYAFEETPLGTGGGVLNAMHGRDNLFFVLNGDTFFDLPLQVFYDEWIVSGADAALALKVTEDVSRYGTVSTDEEKRILQFQEKGSVAGMGLINGGVYIIDPEWLRKHAPGTIFSLERDVFEKVVHTDHLLGVAFEDYFIDIGIPEDYEKAQRDFRGR